MIAAVSILVITFVVIGTLRLRKSYLWRGEPQVGDLCVYRNGFGSNVGVRIVQVEEYPKIVVKRISGNFLCWADVRLLKIARDEHISAIMESEQTCQSVL